MKTRLLYKKILLYITILICILISISIDDLYEQGYLIISILVVIGLIYGCKKAITKEDFNKIFPE